MNWKSALFWLLLLADPALAQQDFHVYSWDQAQKCSPDTVYAISFKKMKLDSLPAELARFTQLRALDLSFNRLERLPVFMGDFRELEDIDFSKNKFSDFPEILFSLKKLKKIRFNRNSISSIPERVSELQQLAYLDFWDNPLARFPEAFLDLPELRTIHAEGIKYGPKFQKRWIESLPNCRIFFDPPCDCVED